MAWFSLISVLFYIVTGISWGPMRKAEHAFEGHPGGGTGSDSEVPLEDEEIIDHPASGSLLNFFIPILSTVLMVPVVLYITGDRHFSKGSGSMSVYSGVMFGTVVSFVWFLARGILKIDSFFKELYVGYAGMVKIASVTHGVISGGFAVGFVFLVAAVMSLATGTSWGTFAIMIPIGVQLGVSVHIPPEYMIGAAISGSIFGDMTSPISADAIVASMATNCDHIEHIRTQFPYALATGFVVLLVYLVLGFSV